MERRSILRIGLPSGRHIREEVHEILSRAGISIPFYPDINSHRVYKHNASLPSGVAIEVIIENPRDLIYGLIGNTCDIIITGSDFILDWRAFQEKASNLPQDWKKANIKIMLAMDQIINCTGNLCFLLPSTSKSHTLDDFITHTPRPICFTEFPYIAAADLQKKPAYIDRYGSLPPLILSSFSSSGQLSRTDQLRIIYSHGLSESKGQSNPNGIVFDLVRTGFTAALNNLKVIDIHEEKICIGMYGSDFFAGSRVKLKTSLELLKLFKTALSEQKKKISLFDSFE